MRKSKRVFFNPESNVPAFLVGIVFKNMTEFRMAVAKYAIAKGVKIKFEKMKIQGLGVGVNKLVHGFYIQV